MLIRLAWVLALVLPCAAGNVAGFPRLPGLVGVRDAVRSHLSRDHQQDGLMTDQNAANDGTAANKAPLRCFEVHHPVLTPDGTAPADRPAAMRSYGDADAGNSSCTAVLMEHSFGNSYGSPYVGGSNLHAITPF